MDYEKNYRKIDKNRKIIQIIIKLSNIIKIL